MAPHIYPRRENPVAAKIYLEGGLAAGVVCFAVLLLLCVFRFRRSKTNKKRIAERSDTHFHVERAARPMMTEATSSSTRHGLTSITMPKKSIIRNLSSHDSLDRAVVLSTLGPSPAFPSLPDPQHRPLSTISSILPLPRARPILNRAPPRHSRASSAFSAFAQYPFSSGLGSRPSSTISASFTQARPVRQLFEAALPDELALVQYGEHLTVLRSFDDGWCLVARDTSRSSLASRLSIWVANNGDNVDIGLVPAWVFVKPLKGITVTRPFRNASVDALRLGQNPTRIDAIIPRSNSA